MAGGAVLAILADFRYFDQDRGVICFAEAKVGVPVPREMVAIIAGVCSPAWIREVVMLGKNMKAPDALAAGLADGLAPAPELDALVEKQIARLSRLSLDVVKACKASIRAPILSKGKVFMADGDGDGFAGFLGPDYLEEGLKAYLEGRQPVFRK
jgi:enoyl-CoA hydratase/carnithine racemase